MRLIRLLQVDAHVDTLVSEQAGFALNRAGFRLVYERMQTWDGSSPLSHLPNMDANTLQAVMVCKISPHFVCLLFFNLFVLFPFL